MAMTALPSPVKAGGTSTGSGGSGKSSTAQSYESLKAAYGRLKSASNNLSERQKEMVGDIIATAELQFATFSTSVLSGYAAMKGKSLKVMGVDLRPIIGGGMVAAGILMDDYGEHPLALGNGVLASWTAEVGFDLGARWGASKEQIEAAKAGDKKLRITREVKVGELPDYRVGEGDEPPVRVAGDGARREPVRAHASDETGEDGDDEVGILGLSVKERFNRHVKKWRVHNEQADVARAEGRGSKAANEEGEALEHKLKAMQLYRKYGEKKGLSLPAEWKRRSGGGGGGGRRRDDDNDNDNDGGRRIRVMRPGMGPRRRRRMRREDPEAFDFDDDGPAEDEEFDDFDEVVQNMSDDELESLAGIDEENEEGITDGEFPDDDEVGDDDDEVGDDEE